MIMASLSSSLSLNSANDKGNTNNENSKTTRQHVSSAPNPSWSSQGRQQQHLQLHRAARRVSVLAHRRLRNIRRVSRRPARVLFSALLRAHKTSQRQHHQREGPNNSNTFMTVKSIRELQGRITRITSELLSATKSHNIPSLTTIPLVQVIAMQQNEYAVHITCENWSGLLFHLLEKFENVGINISEANIGCRDDIFVFDAIANVTNDCQLKGDQLRPFILSNIQLSE